MSCNHTQPELTGHLLCVHSEAFADGAQAEQERIIKLLEDEKFILPEGIDEGTTYMPIQEAISLIKGEE